MSEIQFVISMPRAEHYGADGVLMATLSISMDEFGYATLTALDHADWLNPRTEEDARGISLRWDTPPIFGAYANMSSIGKLIYDQKLAGLLQRVHDGHTVAEYGGILSGSLNDDAKAANNELLEYLPAISEKWTDGTMMAAETFFVIPDAAPGLDAIHADFSDDEIDELVIKIVGKALVKHQIRLDPYDVYDSVTVRVISAGFPTEGTA